MKRIFNILFLLFGIVFGYAQIFPVQANVYFIPPYSVQLSDYATSTTDKMVLQLLMQDVSVANRQVKLKLYIEGNGLKIQSAPVVVGAAPLYLTGGVMTRLTNIDLRPYFQLQNLTGINSLQYSKPLPEGMYLVSWEVFDFMTNQPVSMKATVPVYLLQNDPPILNLPARGENIQQKDPVNIVFQWTPRHMNATNVSYLFEMREIWDSQIDPQAAFLSSPNYYSEETYATTLFYNMSKPVLLPGKTYAWRVKARSMTGISENNVFKNNGYSEIYYFKYSTLCGAPRYPIAEALSSKTEKIEWEGLPEHNKYHVQYRKKGTSEWFEVYTLNTSTQISNLQAGTIYEFRVGGTCDPLVNLTQGYTYTNINEFAMPKKGETDTYNCGIKPEIKIANSTPLTNLSVNESFTAGDFTVTVKEISGQNGYYTGTGYVIVPYLADTRLAVEFKNIFVNIDRQLADGSVETSYDPIWKNVVDLNPVIDPIIEAIGDAINGIGKFFDDLLGGKYDDLPPEQKQEISNQYNKNIDDVISKINGMLDQEYLSEDDKKELVEIEQRLENSKTCAQEGLYCKESAVSNNTAAPRGPAPAGIRMSEDCKAEAKKCAENLNIQETSEKLKEFEEKAESASTAVAELELEDSDDINSYSVEFSPDIDPPPYKIYISPAGKLIVLSGKAIPIFDKTTKITTKANATTPGQVSIPDGALTGFVLDGLLYKGYYYQKKGGKWYFEGYKACLDENRQNQKAGKPCVHEITYSDINKQYQSIIDKIANKDKTVLQQLGAKSFETIPIGIGLRGASIEGTAITPVLEQLATKGLLKAGGLLTKGIKFTGVLSAVYTIWDIFCMPSTYETVGVGELVPSLPIALPTSTSDGYVANPPKSIPIAIPHDVPQSSGNCQVYVIWKTSASGDISVAKYGKTCQNNFSTKPECNPRPEYQVNKFNSENDGYVYNYSWIISNVSNDVAILVERSMIALYIIRNGGSLPSHHKRPCFKEGDDFDTEVIEERMRRAKEYLNSYK